MPTPTDTPIDQQLRTAIDQGDQATIQKIFNEHSDLDWNAITKNGLSALWFALAPPVGQEVNEEIVTQLLQLRRNGRYVIDSEQRYVGRKAIDYNNYVRWFLSTEIRHSDVPENNLTIDAHSAQTTPPPADLTSLSVMMGGPMIVEKIASLPAAYKAWYQALLSDQKRAFIDQFNGKIDAITEKAIIDFAIENNWLHGLSLKGCDLARKDLRGLDLRGVDFSDADLRGANLGLMQAKGAKWDQCDLTGAVFNRWLYPEALLGSKHCTTALLCEKNHNGDNLLQYAFAIERDKSKLIVTTILASKHCTEALLRETNRDGLNALQQAIDRDQPEIVSAIVQSQHRTEVLLRDKNRNGLNALQYAIFCDQPEIVAAILQSGHCKSLTLNHREKEYFISFVLPILLRGKTRAELLDLFKSLKDPEGPYSCIHKQRHATFDRFRLFFRCHHQPEQSFWHTATFQKAMKKLQDKYKRLERDGTADNRQDDAQALIDYTVGNFSKKTQQIR